MPERIFSYAKFNLDALLSLAGDIRGRPCTCDTAARPKAGSMNWVVFVTFDDGLDWVFRSPRTGFDTIMSDASARKMLLSEVATLKLLRERAAVPVPEVYSFSGSCDNPVGVPYILMSRAPGRPLSEYEWVPVQIPGFTQLIPLLPLSDEARDKVMRQLGVMMARLSTLRFDKIGSLFEESSGNYVMGECLSPALIWEHRDSLEDDAVERGPFSHEAQYLESLIAALVGHAKELPLTPHVFFAPIPDYDEYPTWSSYRAAVDRWNDYVAIGAKVESSKNCLDFCIAGQALRRMVPSLSTPGASYTLSHPDLHGGNIFVDDEHNVTCLIDWGSASTGPLSELLSTPRIEIDPSQQRAGAFRLGFSAEHLLPPGSWERADMMWYFSRFVRLISTHDFSLFKALYKLVYKTNVDDADIVALFNEWAADAGNRELFETLRNDDLSVSELQSYEASHCIGYLGNKSDRRAVAGKLTVMAELNKDSVTSSKLWRWIEAALEA